ncbi:MAG: CpsD/CapB family tyrosine-protein kinase [Hydrogenophilaceae bacterium]|nr:CpsD/CapB family tyrosine-protein kinase [Hydrogenophilaceae bacterium]
MMGSDMGSTEYTDEAPERQAAMTAQAVAADLEGDFVSVSYSQTRVVQLNPGHLERHRIVAHDKADPGSRAFDLLRTQVLHKMEEKGWRTLAVTSPSAGAGKTVVAINLAMSIAHQTQKTAMLVDFDLRKPKLGAYMGLPAGISLNEVLDGSATLPDVLVNPGLPRLVLLPTERPVPNPSETLFSRRVANLVADLRERYESRIVIFDLPPLLNTDDAIAVLPQIDCVLLVVGDGMSPNVDVEESLRMIPQEKLLGVVLNKAEEMPRVYY